MKTLRFLLIPALIIASSCATDSSETTTNTEITAIAYESQHQAQYVFPPAPSPERKRTWNVGLLVMDGVFNTELTAPMDIFHHTKFRSDTALRVFTIAKTMDTITSFEGLNFFPDFAYTDTFPAIDILVLPSAEGHLDSDLEDEQFLQFIRDCSASAKFITSHCDGAFPLAEAGVLDGIECTTFPGDLQEFKQRYPHLTVHEDVMFVHDGKFITSAGGAKSFEAALYLHQLLFGKSATEKTAEGMVIDWDLSAVPHKVVAQEK